MATGFVIVSEDSWACDSYTGSCEVLSAAKDMASKAYTLFANMHTMGLPRVYSVTADLQKGYLIVTTKDGITHNICVDFAYPDVSYRSVLEFVQQTWLSDYSASPAAVTK